MRNYSKYDNEQTNTGKVNAAAMVDPEIEQLDKQITNTLGDADALFEQSQMLNNLADQDDAMLEGGNVTTKQAMASMKTSDAVMAGLKRYMTDPMTQESITADPKASMATGSKDKRSVGKKAIDIARKALTVAVGQVRKLVTKLLTYFNKFESAIKDLNAELTDIKNWDSKQKYDQDDLDTVGELIRNVGALTGKAPTNGGEWISIMAPYEVGTDITKEFDAAMSDTRTDLPNSVGTDDTYKAIYIGLYAEGAIARLEVIEKDGKEETASFHIVKIEAPEYKDGENTLDGIESGDIKIMLDIASKYGKNFSKSIDKAYKRVDEAKKDFDKLAKAMKKDPSTRAQNEYNAALSRMKAAPKEAHVVAMGVYNQTKAFIKIASIAISGQDDKKED